MKMAASAARASLLLSLATALNVVMLSTDSMDGRVLDPHQHLGRSVQLPHLRALAARGTSFVNTYTHSPVCGPSRASALTSRYLHDIGVWNNYQELPAESPLGALDTRCVKLYGAPQCRAWAQAYPLPGGILFDAFVEAGYDMRIIGKVDIGANVPARYNDSDGDQVDHTGPEARCVPRGAGLNRNSMAWGGWSSATGNDNAFPEDWNRSATAVAWLGARAAQVDSSGAAATPFFLYMGLDAPHPPFVSGPKWLRAVNRSTINRPYLPTNATPGLHPYDWHMSISKGAAEPTTEAAIMQIREVYLAMCAQADAMHGAVLDALAASPFANDTLVVYWSDHGEMAFQARQVLKDSFREPSARVPLIFAGPGIAQGRSVEAPASLLDLWPTLSDLVGGLRSPSAARGYTLAPAMAPVYAPRAVSYVAGEFFGENSDSGCFFLRQGDFKYLAYGQSFPWFQSYGPQLFNVSQDPDETENLAQRLPGVVAQMDALLVTALGEDYRGIDARVMANDQLIFQRYLTAGMTLEGVRAMMQGTYKGFSEADWQRLILWNATAPVVGGGGQGVRMK